MSKKDKIVSFGQINIDASRFFKDPDTDNLPIIATRDLVLFPNVTFPITLGREISIATAEKASKEGTPVGIICQTDPEIDSPVIPDDLYTYGVLADVVKIFDIPDGPKTAIVRARNKIKLIDVTTDSVGSLRPSYVPMAKVKIVREQHPKDSDDEFIILANTIRDKAISIINKTVDTPNELTFNLENCAEPEVLINLICTHTPFPSNLKQEMLAIRNIKERGYMLLSELDKNEQMVDITREIHERTKQSMNEQQRNAFLQQQMETIRMELYGDDDDASMFRAKAEKIDFPEDVRKTFDREVDKLSRLNPQSPDYSVQYSYLDLLTTLPWGKKDPLIHDLLAAKHILDADHYGLEKVKDRILEMLAVLMNSDNDKSAILCLVGAPGVGKTSLGQSIAKALGRKYQRVSLGGLHDEAELRGHRRTYIGAMPGRIIDAMRRAGSSNPVILLDEIDKMGSDVKSDPSAAMLEILDPEQNCRFHDNYVDVDYDLSKVLFIATANTLNGVSQPLIDRMEVIDISGYLLEEKIEIAERHLIPRIIKEHNFDKARFRISRDAIIEIIEGYTSESGVRQLEKKLAAIVRKAIMKKMSGEKYPMTVQPKHLTEFLGVKTYTKDRYEGNDYPGVVTGLAWTAVGGEILFVETSAAPGKGEKLTLTGNLGDVMKESAVIALQYVRAHADQFNIDPRIFEKYLLHIHVPEGAIPKDGPSAGITMATSIVSALTRRKVRERTAMTGEITLRGKVLPVGGIKEKILAAKRAGINRIILSADNKKDIDDIPQKYIEDLTFDYVNDISEVIDKALLDETIGQPLPLD